MRPIQEILRTYNIVNSRAGSRYTVRFTAALLLTGAFVVAGAMLLIGGPDRSTVPDSYRAAEEGTPGAGPEGSDPFTVLVEETEDTVYIGYPTHAYDPAQKDRYDRDALNTAAIEWLAAHPETPTDGALEPVHDPNGDGVLLGYIIHLLEPPTLP